MNRAGLLQAGRLIVITVVLSCAAGAVWHLIRGVGFLTALGISLIGLGGLIGVTGGGHSSRAGTADIRAHLGAGPERATPDLDGALTGVGVFVLVSLPLIVLGFATLAVAGQ